MTENNFAWNVKIPASLAAGSYVLRHEIIGLHSAGNPNGAQNYPQVSDIAIHAFMKQTNICSASTLWSLVVARPSLLALPPLLSTRPTT